jgi:hypothetical protein
MIIHFSLVSLYCFYHLVFIPDIVTMAAYNEVMDSWLSSPSSLQPKSLAAAKWTDRRVIAANYLWRAVVSGCITQLLYIRLLDFIHSALKQGSNISGIVTLAPLVLRFVIVYVKYAFVCKLLHSFPWVNDTLNRPNKDKKNNKYLLWDTKNRSIAIDNGFDV